MTSEARIWTVEITFTADGDRTRADAHLRAADRELSGWGRSRRSRHDPDVPVVGEEVAAARALSDLVRQLTEEALGVIETFEDDDETFGDETFDDDGESGKEAPLPTGRPTVPRP